MVQEGREDSLDPARPLRCFVGGQLAGTMTLAECAKKNGVATRALDLGVDSTGALAAASDSGPVVQPPDPGPGRGHPQRRPAGLAAGRRPRGQREWRPHRALLAARRRLAPLPTDLTLNACVQALFAGRCEKAGDAAYGRWGEETLRLLPRRVEISADNRTFRPLVDVSAGCAPMPVPG